MENRSLDGDDLYVLCYELEMHEFFSCRIDQYCHNSQDDLMFFVWLAQIRITKELSLHCKVG
jgi:hypothetical protein